MDASCSGDVLLGDSTIHGGLFCWLLWGDFAWSMKERSIGSVVQLVLRQMGASDTIAAMTWCQRSSLGAFTAASGR